MGFRIVASGNTAVIIAIPEDRPPREQEEFPLNPGLDREGITGIARVTTKRRHDKASPPGNTVGGRLAVCASPAQLISSFQKSTAYPTSCMLFRNFTRTY